MYSEFWSNKSSQSSGNPTEMLRELVRIGFEQAVARAEASARMARSLAGCRTPLDAISVYQDWMVNESQRVVADMRRMAELTRTLLQQSSDVAMLNMPIDTQPMPEDGKAAAAAGKGAAATDSAPVNPSARASAAGQSAPEPKPGNEPSPKSDAAGAPKADASEESNAPANEAAPAAGKAAPGKKTTTRKKQATAAES